MRSQDTALSSRRARCARSFDASRPLKRLPDRTVDDARRVAVFHGDRCGSDRADVTITPRLHVLEHGDIAALRKVIEFLKIDRGVGDDHRGRRARHRVPVSVERTHEYWIVGKMLPKGNLSVFERDRLHVRLPRRRCKHPSFVAAVRVRAFEQRAAAGKAELAALVVAHVIARYSAERPTRKTYATWFGLSPRSSIFFASRIHANESAGGRPSRSPRFAAARPATVRSSSTSRSN